MVEEQKPQQENHVQRHYGLFMRESKAASALGEAWWGGGRQAWMSLQMGNWGTSDLPGAGRQQPCPAQSNLFSLLTSPGQSHRESLLPEQPDSHPPTHPTLHPFIYLCIHRFIHSFKHAPRAYCVPGTSSCQHLWSIVVNQQSCPGTSSHELTAECTHLFSTAPSLVPFL